MLDVTGAELLVLVGAAAIFLGKKEVPQLARMAGRGTGKMVALLNTAREQFTKATQDTQLSKLHDEVRQNMYELHSIRSELRSAGLAGPARPGFTTTPMAAAASARLQPSSTTAPAVPPPPPVVPAWPVPPPAAAAPVGGKTVAAVGRGGGSRLGELAMTEILLQEADAHQHPPSRAAAAAAPAPAASAQPPSGADVVEDVILETLIRDHVDHFS